MSYSPSGSYVEPERPHVPLRHYVVATFILFFTAAFYWYWRTFPMINTRFTHGYPQAATVALFQSARHSFNWWLVWGLSLNGLLPQLLAFALANSDIHELTRFHKWVAGWLYITNRVLIVLLSAQWLFLTNNAIAGIASAFNDYRWCCVYFPSPWCHNAIACTPTVSSAALSINFEGLQHWAFAWVFALISSWHLTLNANLREFGVLK